MRRPLIVPIVPLPLVMIMMVPPEWNSIYALG